MRGGSCVPVNITSIGREDPNTGLKINSVLIYLMFVWFPSSESIPVLYAWICAFIVWYPGRYRGVN